MSLLIGEGVLKGLVFRGIRGNRVVKKRFESLFKYFFLFLLLRLGFENLEIKD